MDPNQQPIQPQQPQKPMQPVQPVQPQQPMAQPMEQPVQMAEQMPQMNPADNPAMVQPEPMNPLEQQMATEMENSRMAEEQQQAQMAAAAAANAAAAKPKSNMGMLIGLICTAVIAIAGIGFGVLMMVQKNNDAASYNKQITALKKTNSELSDQVNAAASELTSDEALALLQGEALATNADYTIPYANVYARYTGDENATAYWVKYVARANADGAMSEANVIFELTEDDEWMFVLPGFTEYDQSILTNYEIIAR